MTKNSQNSHARSLKKIITEESLKKYLSLKLHLVLKSQSVGSPAFESWLIDIISYVDNLNEVLHGIIQRLLQTLKLKAIEDRRCQTTLFDGLKTVDCRL